MKNPWRELSKVNPQKENGHREINNDIYHTLMATKLPGAVCQIVLTVIDRTWGFAKHGAPISLAQFQRMTGLSHSGVCSAIKQAEQLRLLVIERYSTKVSEYMFNKHYDTWLTSPPESTSTSPPEDTSERNRLVHQRVQDLSTREYKTSPPESTSTSPVATPRTEPVKKLFKETLKETLKEKGAKKKRYGEFNNVLLSDKEYQKLVDKWGEAECLRMIEVLSSGMQSRKKYRYDDHYAAILSWKRREEKDKGGQHAGRDQPPGQGAGAHRKDTGKGDKFSGFRAIESGPDDRDED